MWKKLLACCMSVMLVLGCTPPAAFAKAPSTPTNLCEHAGMHKVLCWENLGNYAPYDSRQHVNCIDDYNEIRCDACDTLIHCEFVREEAVDERMLANHTFHAGGKRTVCGYGACKHVNTTTQQIKKIVWDWKDVLDGATHYRVLDIDEQVVCQDCSQIVTETLVQSPAYEVEDHKSVDGACSVRGAPYCEYKNAF